MKITIDIDPSVLKNMMKEDAPKRRRKKKVIKEQARIDNQAGEEYEENSKVWNSGVNSKEWEEDRKGFWI
jgi:hypothetical protein